MNSEQLFRFPNNFSFPRDISLVEGMRTRLCSALNGFRRHIRWEVFNYLFVAISFETPIEPAKTLSKYFATLAERIEALANYFATLAEQIEALANYFATFAEQIEALSNYFATFAEQIEALSNYFATFAEQIEAHRTYADDSNERKFFTFI